MGKTKITAIDDSAPEVEEKVVRKKFNVNPETIKKEKVESRKIEDRTLKMEDGESIKNPLSTLEGLPSTVHTPSSKKTKSPKKGKKERSKKYLEASEKVEKSKLYPLEEAVEVAKSSSYSSFGGSLEIHLNTSAKNLRGLVSLPFASGKKLKILAFGPSTGSGLEKELTELEVEVGTDEKLKEVEKGKIDFDVLVTSPEWMPKFARLAKVLGPRGLMPNPKNGTISTDLKKAVAEIQAGKVEYKTQKDSQVIHLSIGKVSQPTEEVVQNIKVLFNSIGKTKTKKLVLSPSMGPGVKVDLGSI